MLAIPKATARKSGLRAKRLATQGRGEAIGGALPAAGDSPCGSARPLALLSFRRERRAHACLSPSASLAHSPAAKPAVHPPARTISGCCFSASSRCRVSPGLPGLPGAPGASRRTFLGRSGAACSLSRRKGRGRRVVGKPGTGRGPPWIVPNGIGSAAAAYL